MKLNPDKILERANELYVTRKTGVSTEGQKQPTNWLFRRKPSIQSDQVKSMLEAICEAMNENDATARLVASELEAATSAPPRTPPLTNEGKVI